MVDQEYTSDIERLTESVESFSVDLTDDSLTADLSEMADSLRDQVGDLRDRVGAWASSAAEQGDDIEEDLRHRLEAANAEAKILSQAVRAELAANRDELLEAAHEQLDGWHQLIDELRLKAGLAKLEAQDVVGELEDAYQAARRRLDEGGDDHSVASLKEAVRSFFESLRKTSEQAKRRI